MENGLDVKSLEHLTKLRSRLVDLMFPSFTVEPQLHTRDARTRGAFPLPLNSYFTPVMPSPGGFSFTVEPELHTGDALTRGAFPSLLNSNFTPVMPSPGGLFIYC